MRYLLRQLRQRRFAQPVDVCRPVGAGNVHECACGIEDLDWNRVTGSRCKSAAPLLEPLLLSGRGCAPADCKF